MIIALLIELLVVIAIIALLIDILLPVIGKSRSASKTLAHCSHPRFCVKNATPGIRCDLLVQGTDLNEVWYW